MLDPGRGSAAPRSALRDILLLTALCWASYCLGLTAHGLTNWQEAQRALVARDMQARADWIVPTVDGKPYLAKPPLFYWCQLGLASARGAPTGEFDLRLTVALAGWLGVIATYVVARRMLGAAAAWWSSLFLATGLLYLRSARIGELDIVLVPFTVIAVGALHAAWRTHLTENRSNLGAVALAALAASGAMLTKGPPALLAIALAGYGGIAVREACGEMTPRRGPWLGGAVIGVLLAIASAWFNGDEPWDVSAVLGLILLAGLGTLAGATLIRLASPPRLLACFRAYAHTHPIAVLGLPCLALWAWGRMVEARVGAAAVATAVHSETADNLRLLVPESSLNNLVAAAYGAGIGSLAAAGAGVWIISQRRRLSPELWMLVAWAVGGLIAFSLLGKGVPRYLTPLWPALAMLGGWGMAELRPRVRSPRRLIAWTIAMVIALAAAQTIWYGWARESWHPERSPRGFVAELLAIPGVEPSRLATFEFDNPGIDFYAGAPIEVLGDIVARPGLDHLGPRTTADLRDQIARDQTPFTLLIRKSQPSGQTPEPATDRLRAVGLRFEEIPLHSRFAVDNQHTDIGAVRILPPG